MSHFDLAAKISAASSLGQGALTRVLLGVRDRAALTLGVVAVRSILFAIASKVEPFDEVAAAIVGGGEIDALAAACANAPAESVAVLLTEFLDVLDRLTGGVMREPLLEVAATVLAEV